MNSSEFQRQREERIQAAYLAVPDHIKEDICAALQWAKKALTEHEGAGHLFNIIGESDKKVSCSFHKAEWSGDHCSRAMDYGEEAVVMAVCEYLNGA